jgi:hypothetical protein
LIGRIELLGAEVGSLVRLHVVLGVSHEEESMGFMTNAELQEILGQFPGELNVDVMFPNDLNVYNIAGVEQVELSQGRQVLVVEIDDYAPVAAV